MNSITNFVGRMRAPACIALVLLIGLSGPAAAAGFTDFLNNVVDEFNSARRPLGPDRDHGCRRVSTCST